MIDHKYRGLTTKGEMIYGSLVVATHGLKHKQAQMTKTWIVESAFGNGGWFHILRRQYVRPKTVGQFTGLKDSQGIDIYEGDIVEDEEHYYSVISWDNEGSMYVASDVGGLDDMYFPIKVVGNIHENPELLEVVK